MQTLNRWRMNTCEPPIPRARHNALPTGAGKGRGGGNAALPEPSMKQPPTRQSRFKLQSHSSVVLRSRRQQLLPAIVTAARPGTAENRTDSDEEDGPASRPIRPESPSIVGRRGNVAVTQRIEEISFERKQSAAGRKDIITQIKPHQVPRMPLETRRSLRRSASSLSNSNTTLLNLLEELPDDDDDDESDGEEWQDTTAYCTNRNKDPTPYDRRRRLARTAAELLRRATTDMMDDSPKLPKVRPAVPPSFLETRRELYALRVDEFERRRMCERREASIKPAW